MFEHELALALGRTIRELQLSMDAREWARWQAYYRVRPFGEMRGDVRHALLCSLLYSLNGGRRPMTVEKFLPFPDESARDQSPREMALLALLATGATKKKV